MSSHSLELNSTQGSICAAQDYRSIVQMGLATGLESATAVADAGTNAVSHSANSALTLSK